MRRLTVPFAAAALWLGGLANPLAAQVQSPQQQTCLKSVYAASLRLAKAQSRAASECLASVVLGQEHPDRCATADPKAKVAAARSKLVDAYAKRCTAEPPDFGLAAVARATAASTAETVTLHERMHNVGGGVVHSSYGDSEACVLKVHGAQSKLFAAKLKAFVTCVRRGLSAEAITSESALVTCLDSSKSAASPKVAKLAGRVSEVYQRNCTVGQSTFDPQVGDADMIADCRACGVASGVADATVDCGLFAEWACSDACGDGATDASTGSPTEPCDDGNFINGDGCDRNCEPTGCGNGAVSDGETCDDGAGRCVGGGYDGLSCELNVQCPGGHCTMCPTGACEAGCGGCLGGTCCTFADDPCDSVWPYGDFSQACAFGMFPCSDPVCWTGTCCVFGDVCTGFNASLCAEYEGTLVDCSQCSP